MRLLFATDTDIDGTARLTLDAGIFIVRWPSPQLRRAFPSKTTLIFAHLCISARASRRPPDLARADSFGAELGARSPARRRAQRCLHSRAHRNAADPGDRRAVRARLSCAARTVRRRATCPRLSNLSPRPRSRRVRSV
jgi:hypothetical protein